MFFSAVDVFAVQLVFCTACVNLIPFWADEKFSYAVRKPSRSDRWIQTNAYLPKEKP